MYTKQRTAHCRVFAWGTACTVLACLVLAYNSSHRSTVLQVEPPIVSEASVVARKDLVTVGATNEEELKIYATSLSVDTLGKILNYRYRLKPEKFGSWDNRDFLALESMGIHLTPVHFYGAIPELSKRSSEFYEKTLNLYGLNLNAHEQLAYALSILTTSCVQEFKEFPKEEVPARVYQWHHSLGFMDKRDAVFLYCFIRTKRPRRIIEIGGGTSTSLMAAAVRANAKEGTSTELRSIEPYPVGALARYVDGESDFPGLSELIQTPLELVDIEVFKSLTEGDILFIDSSHVFREGGDVEIEFMHIIPQLNPGVIIHIHDILLPKRYTADMVLNARFYNEQYFLWAFLAFNSEFEVLWMPSWLHQQEETKFPAVFNSYASNAPPDSFWMRRK